MESVVRYVDWTSAGLAVLAALLSLLLLEIFRLNSSRSRYPPGPRPLPFIGNMLQTMRDPLGSLNEVTTDQTLWNIYQNVKSHTQFLTNLQMANYGDMCTFYLGRIPVVVLNNLQMVKEAFVQNGAMSSGRPEIPVLKWISRGSGILLSNGYEWKQQRRFALHTLRDFGLGKKTVEERVAEESGFLIKEMLKHEGKPFYPIHPIMNAVSNIICSIVFGDRFDYDDKRFAKLLEILNENIRLTGSNMGQICNMFPYLRFFPGPHQKILQNAKALNEFICEAVEERRKTLDPENLRDFIDAYLVEMTKQEANEDSTFDENNMITSTTDLFLAGTETTANTLRWALVFMMEHPTIQERCHEEIVGVLGYDRTPTMDDRLRLPYTYATIHEIQRCANLLPFGVMHETTAPVELQGHRIPRKTHLMANLTNILRDKEYWKHPDTFNPENFLDDKGQFCKQESFLPFSLGPRVCLGEALARMELFIFFTRLLQHLLFSWPPEAPPYNMEGIFGVIHAPCPFKMICRSREASH